MLRPFRAQMSAAIVAISPLSGIAAQNDYFPTDYVSMPNGGASISVYAAQQTLSGPWTSGARTAAGELKANLLAVRASRHFSVGDEGQYTFAPVVVLTATDLSRNSTLSSLGSSQTGIGDLRLGSAFWLYSDRVNREFVVASVFAFLPTGTYDESQLLNIGENRFKTVLSAGWMKTLNERWVMDIGTEAAFFGDNSRYKYGASFHRLSQDAAYALNGTLRYKTTKDWHWYASAQINRGGATQLDGQTYSGAPDNTRLALGTLLFTSDSSQIQLRYAQDTNISNGFRNDHELVLRYSMAFK